MEVRRRGWRCDADDGGAMSMIEMRRQRGFCYADEVSATLTMEVRRQRGLCSVRMGLIEAVEVVVVQINGDLSRVPMG
ncbi:unnamed protein product [Prunus armeniaca]